MDDLQRAQSRGFGTSVGFGAKPALLVVDFTRNFTAATTDLGADMAPQIAEANRLILAARAADAPVYLSTIAYGERLVIDDQNRWWNQGGNMEQGRTPAPMVSGAEHERFY